MTDVGLEAAITRDVAGFDAFLDALYNHYHQDFRGYARGALGRRVVVACHHFGCRGLDDLQNRLLNDQTAFAGFLRLITVQVSQMFRDPVFFRAIREKVIPHLATYPSIKIWVAGCSRGEEAYSYAVVLHEEGLLERSLIYATDISGPSLEQASAGVYSLARIAQFTQSYQEAGGRRAFSDYYAADYEAAVFGRWLKRHIVFSDHSLATDSVFTEVQLVSCRNVLIYFDKALQEHTLGLFSESLCRRGFLALGTKETLRFSGVAGIFRDFAREERIFQKC